MVVLLNIRADFPHFTPKCAEHSRYLPHEWQQGMDRLAQAFAASRITIGTIPVVIAEPYEQVEPYVPRACQEEMQLAPVDWQPQK